MDPFLVLLHSVSGALAAEELTQLKFLVRDRLGKRRLERVQSGLDLFSALLEQGALDGRRLGLLRLLLGSLRRDDLLRLLDDFERGAAGGAGDAELRAAFDVVCDNVGRDWRRLARQLQVPEARIDAIEDRHPRDLQERVRETLRVWSDSGQGAAGVEGLVRALRGCQLNLVADLVEEGRRRPQSDPAGEPCAPGGP